MTNPGSSRPLGAPGAFARATLDPTLRAVIALVEEAYARAELEMPSRGHLAVFNLFTLCEADQPTALKRLGSLPEEAQLVGASVNRRTPWVWRAWGRAHRVLRPYIQHWADRIERLPLVGLPIAGDELGFYHPTYLRRMRKQRPELWEQVVGQISARLALMRTR